MNKILILLLCLSFTICLAACKDEAVGDKISINSDLSNVTDSTDSDKDEINSSDDTTSGVELEEDVFDDDNIVENTSSNNSTSSKPADKDNQSTDKGEDNTSSDKTESNSSSDDVSDTESGDISSDETPTESDDGTVKLPVDWF